MALFRNRYRIESTRLPSWDYAASATYFVTICIHKRRYILGDVETQDVQLSVCGEIAAEQWLKTLKLRTHLQQDGFVIMPNHVHLIFGIDASARNNNDHIHTPNSFGPLKTRSLQSAMNGYKGAVTTACKRAGFADFAWQSRFYEHIIRDEPSLHRIRNYVAQNPVRWGLDHNNAEGLWM